MDLLPGTRVGVLEILGPLGAGGMGEVHRARDTRLGREVAVKILPASLSHDSKRLARFDREARLLAALNHPGIGTIYGVEEASGERLLVLELVPGLTLAERIAAGSLPLGEALSISRQIAEAVAFAHANGILHRDLKPANVKCTPDGRVKVLDFGLAKAVAADSGPGNVEDPTLSGGDTHEGTVLGTPAYMSPEQARGQAVDRRSDVWSFGCILYEVLTRRRAFGRQTRTETLAAVLEQEPDWSALPAATPQAIRTLLRRCLQRDRDRRVHDMADVRIELDEALSSAAQASGPAGRGHAPEADVDSTELMAAGVVALVVAANLIVLPRLVPPLAAFRTEFNEALSLPLRAYLTIAWWAKPTLLLLALLWGVAILRRPLFARARRTLLLSVAGIVLVSSVVGLWLVAEEGVRSAVQQNLWVKGTFVNRELATLHVAAGEPRLALDILDDQHRRDYPRDALVWWGVPGHVFQMAEAYRASGDVEAARRLYQRAREAATAFDETLSQRELSRQELWQEQFGLDRDWKLPVGRVRMLPDVLRAVVSQRLRELDVRSQNAGAAAPRL